MRTGWSGRGLVLRTALALLLIAVAVRWYFHDIWWNAPDCDEFRFGCDGAMGVGLAEELARFGASVMSFIAALVAWLVGVLARPQQSPGERWTWAFALGGAILVANLHTPVVAVAIAAVATWSIGFGLVRTYRLYDASVADSERPVSPPPDSEAATRHA